MTELKEILVFMKQMCLFPRNTGAILPTSSVFAKIIANLVEDASDKYFLEIGPGTGALTSFLVHQVNPEKSLFVDANKFFVGFLKNKFPALNICNNRIEDLEQLMEKFGIKKFDYIVCTIPWSHYSKKDQNKFLQIIANVLNEDGLFVTIGYLHGLLLSTGQSFKSSLHHFFATVSRSKTTWMNTPPVFYYACRKNKLEKSQPSH